MWRVAAFIACTLMGAAVAHAQPAQGAADDDLAVVKRAVEREEPAPAPEVQPRRTEKLRWFRVRIEERKGARVKVNVPLALVRELPDDLDWGCGRRHRACGRRLSEVLALLDAGEDLVEIKDADATVRIWVD